MVEEALARVVRLPALPALTCAGRTDAGVHARGQVAHADLPARAWAEAGEGVSRRLAGVLPTTVRAWRVQEAPPGFDARFSALSRRYSYRVADEPLGVDPLRRHDVLWHPRPVDLSLMNAAAHRLLGERDFAAYCRPRKGSSTVRRLQRLTWERGEDGLAVASVVANAFCHHMVRSLVGALLAVGEGRAPVEWPEEVLDSRVRSPSVQVVRPHGLTLEEVSYPVELASTAGRDRSG